MITHISNAAGGGSVYNGYQFSVTTKPFNNIQWFLHNIDTIEAPGCEFRAGPGGFISRAEE